MSSERTTKRLRRITNAINGGTATKAQHRNTRATWNATRRDERGKLMRALQASAARMSQSLSS